MTTKYSQAGVTLRLEMVINSFLLIYGIPEMSGEDQIYIVIFFCSFFNFQFLHVLFELQMFLISFCNSPVCVSPFLECNNK